jgi:RHS repeat-associated protein
VDHPGDEPDFEYEWGGAGASPRQRGRIVKVTDAAGTLAREYGPLGEVVKETRTLISAHGGKAQTYVTSYVYDTWNRLLEMTYPDGEVLSYGYDSGGLVSSATGKKLGTTYPYVTRLEYDHFGQRAFQQQGNGIKTHYAYDEKTRRLASLEAGEFQRLRYGYDKVGNVTSLVNNLPDLSAREKGGRVSQTFEYDDLHRLKHASGTWTEPGGARNSYELELAYDAIHNLTKKTQTHRIGRGQGNTVEQRETTYDLDYAYGEQQPHAPVRVGGTSYRYDASGRMVGYEQKTGPSKRRVLAWDSEDRVKFIQDGGTGGGRTTHFVYDDQGQRVFKRGAQGETAYVNPHYTVRNGTIATKHVFLGASRVVSKLVPGTSAADLPTETDEVSRMLGRWWQHRSEQGWEHGKNTEKNPHYRVDSEMPSPMGLPESNFVYFYHPDHLGSTSFVTDPGGDIYEHVQYFPHGELWADERSNTQRLPYLFTGKELDEETQLYDFGARMYDPRLAIWVSPDPILDEYLDASPNGGVFTPVNLGLFTYAANNPIQFTDPDGRSWWGGVRRQKSRGKSARTDLTRQAP